MMCRIWGLSIREEDEDPDLSLIAMVLFQMITKGGKHAYGWMQYDGSDVTYYKTPGRADTDAAVKRIYKGFQKDVEWVVGHTRYATLGDPRKNENNHPLQHGNIIGVHNGKITNYQDVLDITGRQDEKALVDSEAIFAAVNKWGHAPGLRKLMGDMVAVYTDLRKPHLLHIARSTNRELSIGWTDKGNLFFASERNALMALEQIGVRFVGMSRVRDNRHLVVSDGDIIYRHTYAESPETHVEPVVRPSRMASAGVLLERVHESSHEIIRGRPSVEEIRRGLKLENGAVQVNPDCFYYKGVLLSADEYLEAVMEDNHLSL